MGARRSSPVDPKDRLPAEWPDLDAEQILRRLTAAGVDFDISVLNGALNLDSSHIPWS